MAVSSYFRLGGYVMSNMMLSRKKVLKAQGKAAGRFNVLHDQFIGRLSHEIVVRQFVESHFFIHEVRELEIGNFCDSVWFRHNNLCRLFFRTRYGFKWDVFWSRINTNRHYTMSSYTWTASPIDSEYVCLLRLVIIEEFIHWLETGEFK